MIHARSDYDRIQDPAGLIPENEPVFLLRGQDPAAPVAVDRWADEAEKLGASPEIVSMARAQANRMRHWQDSKRKRSVPDLPSAVRGSL